MDFYLELTHHIQRRVEQYGRARSRNGAAPASQGEFVAGEISLAHILLEKNPAVFLFEGPVTEAVMSDPTVHRSIIEGLHEGVIDLPSDPCSFVMQQGKYKGVLIVTKFEGRFAVVSFADDGVGGGGAFPNPTVYYDPVEKKTQVLKLPYLPTLPDGRRPEDVAGNKIFHWFMRCLALLNTRDIELKQTAFPRAERRRREREGLSPLPPYHVVKLSHKMHQVARGEGGTHASPRLHLRRGHVRTLESGKKIWIKPFMVGDAARGVVDKHYVVE